MNRYECIEFLNEMKMRAKMIKLGREISTGDLSLSQIIPLIELLTYGEKIYLSFVTIPPITERIDFAIKNVASQRLEKVRSFYRAGQIDQMKEYLMSLPDHTAIHELSPKTFKNDEDLQIYMILNHVAANKVYLSDPIVSKMIDRIKKGTLSAKRAAIQIESLNDIYAMIAIHDAAKHQDVLDPKVIEVLSQACEIIYNKCEKNREQKKRKSL